MKPKIGEPRMYPGENLEVLYPGEVARAQLKVVAGNVAVNWLVEPMPGWHGRWLRLRYRVVGRWLSMLGFGKAKIETNVSVSSTARH